MVKLKLHMKLNLHTTLTRVKTTTTIKEKTSPYGAEKYMPDIKPFTPDYKMLEEALKSRKTTITLQKETDNWIENAITAHNSKYNSRNNAASLEYANLIRNYHKSLSKSTLLHLYIDEESTGFGSDVFVIMTYPSINGNGTLNSMGTQVYTANAFYSYNKKLKAYEIFNIYISDETYPESHNIFKMNHLWDISDRRTKLQDSRPCQSSAYFLDPMLINLNGMTTGGFQSLYIDSECINAVGQKKPNNTPIEVYFIKDLENFIKKSKP